MGKHEIGQPRESEQSLTGPADRAQELADIAQQNPDQSESGEAGAEIVSPALDAAIAEVYEDSEALLADFIKHGQLPTSIKEAAEFVGTSVLAGAVVGVVEGYASSKGIIHIQGNSTPETTFAIMESIRFIQFSLKRRRDRQARGEIANG